MIRYVADRDRMGSAIPWWWGFAWRRYDMREDVLLVIPFNWVAGTLRQWWIRLCEGPRNKVEEEIRKQLEDSRDLNNNLGYKDGYDAAWAHVRRMVAHTGVSLPEREEP